MNRIISVLLLSLISFGISAQTTISKLSCEYQVDPVGIDNNRPALSWQLSAKQRNTTQTAYRVLVADDLSLLQKSTGNVWDSEKVSSAQSIQVTFSGKDLKPLKIYYWKVMVWDNHQHLSQWSKIGTWQMGLLTPADWKGAEWIGYEKLPDSSAIITGIENTNDKRYNEGKDILPLLRKGFSLTKKLKKATVFISGLGQFDLSLNGEKVGDHFLDPGWTKYDKHSLYVTFDVTNKLKPGNNVMGVMLGNGFYYIPGERYHKYKGQFAYPKMICRLALEYADGDKQDIISDGSWKTAPGPVTFSSIYGGEDYNATLDQKGWDKPGLTMQSGEMQLRLTARRS